MLPRRLRSLTIVFSAAFFVAVVATGVGVYSITLATIADLVDSRIADAAGVVAGPGPRYEAAGILRRMQELARERDTADIGIQLDDAQGRRLGGNITLRRRLPVGESTLPADAGIKGLSEGRALVRTVGEGLRLTVVAETEPFDHYNAARVRIYLVGFGSIVLVVLAGMAAFGILVHRRGAEMRRTAEAIIGGDLHQRVRVVGVGGEFDEQALALNRMLDRIAELMDEIGNVSNDVAHDLRTPLARLRSRIALLLREPSSPEIREGLEAALAQCDEILAMFGAVLRIAEVEGGDRRKAFAALDLSKLAAEVAEMMQPIVAETGRRLVVEAGPPAPVRGDRQLLSQALINLIENGARYTPPGGRIVVAVVRNGAGATLTVTDDGPGIPPEQRATAMRRFGRLDASRHTAGHGLGLPLVRAIARLHRGELELADAAPGLCVRMTLPLDDVGAGASLKAPA